tara:strand:- start:14023 stop:14625 length:603 start_codon:yes stop_codon:yes gene_type:complete
MKPLIISVLIILSSLHLSYAQEGYEYNDQIQVLYGVVFNGDTIPMLNIPEISITGHKFENQQDEYWYEYYLKRVKKVYPYYQIAKTVVNDLEDEKDNLKKKHFKQYKKNRKKELMNEFEKELRDLKISEGKVLVKMINRETGQNFYELIKEYNSGMKAWVYNIVANRYDYDLKAPYDPKSKENSMLELAIKQVLGNNLRP